MSPSCSWDFRDDLTMLVSSLYEDRGYVVVDADLTYLSLMKSDLNSAFNEYIATHRKNLVSLDNAHQVIDFNESNDLRLFIMNFLFTTSNAFLKNYFMASKGIVYALCGNELAIQKRPGISVNLPNNYNDVLPIHADTWNGVSPFELNILIPFVNCTDSMSLYILERDKYIARLEDMPGLLTLSSDEMFNKLRQDLTWIPIEYGKVLAFDQSLPHGYSLNRETKTHWSFNCRFKGLHTPYWDKRLGEYFMPITTRTNTRLGMKYSHPKTWL